MKKIVLVGGGHSHVYVIKKLQEESIKDTDITLISPSRYQYYSGMFSGYAEGLYTEDDIRIDLIKLTRNSDVNWIEGAVTSIDPEQKVILTDKGKVIDYDAISFDIGSLTAGIDVPGVFENTTRVKPSYHFVNVIEQAKSSNELVVVGGGASGVEISLSLQAWRKKHDFETPVTLISGSRLLPSEREGISNRIEKIVKEKGIQLLTNTKVTEVKPNTLITSTKKHISFNQVIWLGGPKAPELFKTARLPVDDQGYLVVEDTLQVKEYPSIFGAGDCITMRNFPSIHKVGVYAVRQGPILYKNLKGFMENGDGELYKPQSNYLSILSTGNKEGFLLYKNRSFLGKWAWFLKNRIDRKFMEKFQ